jgi:hypothetical protein
MRHRLDKKSSYMLIVTSVLLISLLLNVYQKIDGSIYKKEIGNEINKSVEEIRTRNESILLTLEGCLVSESITKEEVLTLYKNYSLISISELNLWEKYLNNIENSWFKKDDKVNLAESNQNNIFANIEDLIYSLLLNSVSDNTDSIKLNEKLLVDIVVMKEISYELNEYFNVFMSEKLGNLEGEDKAKKMINKEYWIDILNYIESINNKYKDYMFKL